MKKGFVFFAILLVFSFLFASIAPAGPVLEKILKNGTLRVGTSGSQPPMTATTRKGALIGMDIDIAKLIAAGLGVKVNFVTMPFSKLLPALKAGEVDMVISGMTITQERNRSLAFVGPYYVSGKGILAVAEKYAALQEASGLDTPEVTAAALKDSTSKKFIETLMPKAKMMTTDTYDQAIDLLLKGKIDVFVADLPYCALTAYRFREKGLIAGNSPLNFEPLGIAMREDTLLINWVRNFMIRLKGTGLLTELHKRWLDGGPWVEQLP
jgi:polar amino acid transport system substrate-binding protein